MSINILEGERALAKDNYKLGELNIFGIPSAPKGISKIEVSFELDENGILTVSGKDIQTGKIIETTIHNDNDANKPDDRREQIDHMIENWQKYSD